MQREDEMYHLYWTRADAQGDMDMGQYPTREAASAAIPAQRGMLLGQCATDEDRAEILAGRWDIIEEADA